MHWEVLFRGGMRKPMRGDAIPVKGKLLELAHYPPCGVRRQVRQQLQELLDVVSRDPRTEVVAQEAVKMPGNPFRQETAPPQRRDDEPLHRPKPPAARDVARELLALGVEAREHRRGVDPD